MRFSQFDELSPAIVDGPLPWHQRQSCSTFPGAFVVVALAATALALLVPTALVVARLAAGDDAARQAIDNPGSVIQIALGVAFLSAMIGWPLYLTSRRIGRRRDVVIDHAQVTVRENAPAGRSQWSEPLSAYLGVAHHLRTTQAGPRHELVLVHPDPRRHVVVASAERLTRADLERVARQLGLDEVPAAALYRLPDINGPLHAIRRRQPVGAMPLETVEV